MPSPWSLVRNPGVDYPLRTSQSIKAAADKAEEEGGVVDGIKGKSVLSSVINLAIGFPIDYMHCVLEGVVKRMLGNWASSTNHGNYYYLGRSLGAIDANLISQCPPHDFSRAPRSIKKHRKFWKASEYLAWILYYALPLTLGHLPPLYFHHFALLVCAIHILLQPTLSHTKIDAAEEMLKDFLLLVPELYGTTDCVLNIHLLVHLCQHVRHWGPLWAFSAFGFESMNGHIVGPLHGTYRIADQLLFSIRLNETFSASQEKLLSTETEQTLSFLSLEPKLNCGTELIPGSYTVGQLHSVSLPLEERRAIKALIREWPKEVATFARVYHQGTILHSKEYSRPGAKRDSTVCYFYVNGNHEYGTIEKLCLVNKCPIALVKPFKQSGSILEEAGVPGRQTLQGHARIDILSTFINRVENEQLPSTAVHLESILRKCIRVHQNTSQHSYIIKVPNYNEHL